MTPIEPQPDQPEPPAPQPGDVAPDEGNGAEPSSHETSGQFPAEDVAGGASEPK